MKIYSKLLQTSFSGVSTLVKILTGMLSLKIIALYAGPEGIAILGQFMSLANIFATIAGGGIALGVIKYVAEYAQTDELHSFYPPRPSILYYFLLLQRCWALFIVNN